ncbi:DUF1643 domain-containing protein [Bifidobacterium sp. ESL0690]|uniref:DUF1643 domain-containing protein n=1 Tax=Bifidobacterium sp. ESL0690 TaxID=2983214 RepID=UPI0023F7475A|nr:DUF1643 domain-containing protein [Bifidobacterium sp. ESL0690]WEV47152.1 DUF1643 domain-containing protein [Bifidobacterium sp. ESL0690]
MVETTYINTFHLKSEVVEIKDDKSEIHAYRNQYDIRINRKESAESLMISNQEDNDQGTNTLIFIGLNPSDGGSKKITDPTIESLIQLINGDSSHLDEDNPLRTEIMNCNHLIMVNLFTQITSKSNNLTQKMNEGINHKKVIKDTLNNNPNAIIICGWGAQSSASKYIKIAIDEITPVLKSATNWILCLNGENENDKYTAPSWSPLATGNTELPLQQFKAFAK